MHESHKVVRGIPESVGEARHWLTRLLSTAGFPGIDDAAICLSELVTNSVKHSRSAGAEGRIRIKVTTAPSEWVQIEVRDAGPASWPTSFGNWVDGELRPPADASEAGRGLYMVVRLAGHLAMDPKGGMFWVRLTWGDPIESPSTARQEVLW